MKTKSTTIITSSIILTEGKVSRVGGSKHKMIIYIGKQQKDGEREGGREREQWKWSRLNQIRKTNIKTRLKQ